VVKPEILLRRRFDGTVACYFLKYEKSSKIEVNVKIAHDFIDDSLVGVEVEG
jgi:hypothetical protein